MGELPRGTTASVSFPVGLNAETWNVQYVIPLTEPGVLVRLPFELVEVMDFEKEDEGRTSRAKRRRSFAMLEPEVT